MEANNLAGEQSALKCLCSTGDDYHVLFSADDKTVCQCNKCGQVSVRGIDKSIVEAEYDESTYFTERNNYLTQQKEIASQFQVILDRANSFKSGGTFLDIGCSIGIFLDVARHNGFDVRGVEISKWASEFARQKGFDVVNGGLEDVKYSDKSFDLIVMNHVLEHIPAPGEILVEVKRILKDDGVIVIGVPNFGSYMA